MNPHWFDISSEGNDIAFPVIARALLSLHKPHAGHDFFKLQHKIP